MWILEKPSFEKAINDIALVVDHCRKIGKECTSAFEKLYMKYDESKGIISNKEHEDFVGSYQLEAEAMKRQYENLGKGKYLEYIREELIAPVDKCPYCGMGEATTLDHFLPKSVYKELATCRLNLVPLCWKCNLEKKDKDFNGFIHSYYQDFPLGVIFFKCFVEISKEGALIIDFYVDGQHIEQILKKKLDNQIKAIELNERLRKECISYITSNFSIDDSFNDDSLRFFLADKIHKAKISLGANHWQTAFLQGLYDCDAFNVKYLNKFLQVNKRNIVI